MSYADDLIFVPIVDFDDYAPPDEARAYRQAIVQYIEAYNGVFSLPNWQGPNNQAIQRLLCAAERIAALEAGHSYRVGFASGARCL